MVCVVSCTDCLSKIQGQPWLGATERLGRGQGVILTVFSRFLIFVGCVAAHCVNVCAYACVNVCVYVCVNVCA
jgi:hypothetical protein